MASFFRRAWVVMAVMGSLLMVTPAAQAQDASENGKNFPQSPYDERAESRGRLTGDDGLTFLGGKKKDDGGGAGIGVNSFLWRATLDTLAFMPLASADPFGGVIITDWYEDPEARGERFKVNALILDKSLRADGVKVTVFKQILDSKGQWRDQKVDNGLGTKLEDTVLTRARQMRVAQALR